MISKAILLLNSARRNGIYISVNKGELLLKLSKGKVIDQQLLQDIKDHKKEIIEFLINSELKAAKTDLGELQLKPVSRNNQPSRLSFGQERLWFIHQMEGTVQYHIPTVLKLKGKLNKKALQATLRTMVDRHEVLRSVITETGDGACQQVMDVTEWKLSETKDFSEHIDSVSIQQQVAELIARPFDLTKDYMLRAHLISLAAEEFLLVITLHHIAADGWSVSIIVNELEALYRSFVEDIPVGLPVLPVQYADFAIWQRNFLQGSVLESKIAYWSQKLSGVTHLQLPTDYSRPLVQSNRGAITSFTIDKELTGRIQQLGHQQDATLFMTLLAAFKVLLSRYSGQQDICVGTPIAGRQQEEVEGLIGFFVNTLALRTNVNTDASFISLLNDVKKTTLEAYQHQELSFEKVVEVIVKERDMSRSPIFQVMFVLQHSLNRKELVLPELSLSVEQQESTTSKFDFIFFVTETAEGLFVSVEYCSDLYKASSIDRMLIHFNELIKSIVESPEQKAGLLPMLTASERKQLLQDFNATDINFPREKTLIDIFEEQVLKTPENTAVFFEGRSLTYEVLNEKSNQFAHFLRLKGVSEKSLVPICIERSPEMIIGVLGILKAGGAYVPIDPEYPAERINYMIEDSEAELIVSSLHSRLTLPELKGLVVEMDGRDAEAISKQSTGNLEYRVKVGETVYVIYTSGSTGNPKGVKMGSKGMVNLLSWQEKQFVNNQRRVLQFASINFDVSFQEIFSTLCFGSSLYLVTEEQRRDMEGLVEYAAIHQLTHLFVPFIVLKNVVEAMQPSSYNTFTIQEIIVAGEQLKLTADIQEMLRKTGVRLVNQYGPTEAHVVSSYTIAAEGDLPLLPPIGKPVDNTRLYILSDMGQLVPVGVSGELFIGGVQVAEGYVNLPQLTLEKFITDKFSDDKNARLYKTGDLARWLPDGNIEYLGRIDDQVKIRGYRIELGEIESVLQQCGLVEQVVVLAKEDRQFNKQLVSYIVPNGPFKRDDIIEYLKERLPAYMVPALWIEMDEFPVTSNGKVNRKALPDPDINALKVNEYAPPVTETEKALALIWQELLGIKQVGIHDNFFELGGHSLLVMRVVSAIRRQMQIEINIKAVFSFPTIASLASSLPMQSSSPLLPAIEVLPRPVHIPLSFSQERLWFIDKLEGSVQYHLPAVLRLKGNLNEKVLTRAVQNIVNRHEVLRTVFLEEEGQVFQSISKPDDWKLQVVDDIKYMNDREALQQYIRHLTSAPFNLSNDYMLRATLVKMGSNEHLLIATIHHIASDGWSVSIIVKELAAAYAAFAKDLPVTLAPLKVQYADYAIWQRNYLQGEILSSKLAYWVNKLRGVATLQLPTDYPRPLVQSSRGGLVEFTIDKELSEQISALSQRQGVTVFMTLLAGFNVLLQRYSGQNDICVGTPIAGRSQQEVESLIGFFINTLALRNDLEGDPSFTGLLEQVKTTTLEAYAHQEVPFEKVVEAVGTERDMSRNPLFQVLLTLHNTPEVPELLLGDVVLTAEPYEHGISQLDIIVNITETVSGLKGSVMYCADLFTRATIERLLEHFRNLFYAIVQSPGQPISWLPMLGAAEQQQLLVTFNDTHTSQQLHKSLVTLFEEQALRTPGNLAIVFEEAEVSYAELNERASQLAHYLQLLGVKKGELVPVCLERSTAMLVSILGILKAGGAYVPIDPAYPEERINYLLEDTAARVLISSSHLEGKLPSDPALRIIRVDADAPLIRNHPTTNPDTQIDLEQLAYIIYTSGSTGRPKGVMVSHSSLCSYLLNDKTTYVNRTDKGESGSYVHLSFTFDASLTAMFMPLLYGKAVVIGCGSALEVFEDANFIKHAPYDFIKITPAHLELLRSKFIESSHPLTSTLVIGGEALLPGQFDYLSAAGLSIAIVNEYGPTEATVGCTTYSFNTNDDAAIIGTQAISIGKPIDKVSIYILGEGNVLLPLGVPGELCIGGPGVAKGYLNQAALTASRFIANPFNKNPGERLYKTGDLASWDAAGNITYLGRKDDQVKIRGHRVELGEIERVLLECKMVRQAVVITKKDKFASLYIIGYVVPSAEFEQDEILDYLKSHLPEYMIPSLLVELESIPLTINGKVDRKVLPDPESTHPEGTYIAPRNETEKALAAIWEDVLEVEQVGVEDEFFNLGGHSLLAIRLISMIRKAFLVEMQISDIFNYPTIALLAGYLQKQPDSLLLPQVKVAIPRPQLIPLSFSQERLWFIDQLEGSVQYHVPAVFRVKGKLNIEALSYAIQQIINRHEVLRTVIRELDGAGYQFIKEKDNWQLNTIDARKYNGDEDALQQRIGQLIAKPFDLANDHMLRAELLNITDLDCILVLTIHHIASDAWSAEIMVKEMVEFWKAYQEGRQPQLRIPALQYADYAIWQRNYLQGPILENKLSFWKEQLQGIEPLELPTDFVRQPMQTGKGAFVRFFIEEELKSALQSLSRQQGVTLFMTLLAAFKVLLFRYSGQQDIAVGTPIAGRQQQELEGLIGFFLNTLVLRSVLSASDSFEELLQQIRATTLQAYEHQEVPFEKLVETMVKERDMSRSPLFQVMFILQNNSSHEPMHFGEIELAGEPIEHNNTKFELSFNLAESDNGINGVVEYFPDLYTRATIDRMIVHFKTLLKAIVATSSQKIEALQMLTPEEEQQLLGTFNDTAFDYPKEKSIVKLFEEQVLKTPETTALVFENTALTYHQLNEQSNQLAHYLRGLGVDENSLVPVCIDRSIEMVIAVVAILKAGAAYVPIDPDYPVERIRYMLNDLKPVLILSNDYNRQLLDAGENVSIIDMEQEKANIGKQPLTNPDSFYQPGQLAYLMYTSGSTGIPKGVKMPVSALVNLLNWQDKQFVNKQRRVLQFASLNFDVSFQEIFSTICYGSTLYLINAERRKDVNELLKDIIHHQITHLFVPYIVLKNLADALALNPGQTFWLEEVIVAGEQLILSDDITALLGKKIGSIINHYGPTEAHVVSSYTIDADTLPVLLPPIGKPIFNTSLYILDGGGQLVPVGVKGELYIGGVQVADGYLNQPKQTAEKFIKNSFSKDANARLYRTGDIARWLPDGNIEYLGRKDDQVKIRGFRVELGEIESTLQQFEKVLQAVVLAADDNNGAKRLVAYIVPEGAFDRQAMVAFLEEKLPAYMVPAVWIEMNEFPVTKNGKIDKKVLPQPAAGDVPGIEMVAPRNLLETNLENIWSRLLKIGRISVFSNFFELGGHSLLATRVVSAIRKQMEVEMAIKDLFLYPTIDQLGKFLQLQTKGLSLPPVEKIMDRPERIRLSFSQERLWFIHQLEGSLQYHVPAVLRLQGKLNEAALYNALQSVIDRHETLRTAFREEEGQAYQYIKEKQGWKMTITDGAAYNNNDLELAGYIEKLVMQPFDLSEDYMLRANLINLDENEHILVVTMHHIASDGWSASIIVRELVELYSAQEEIRPANLPALDIQYADYALWQRRYLQGALFDQKLGYWKNKLEGVATLALPTDFSRPPVWSSRGALETFYIDIELLNKLKDLSRQTGSTLFMTLMAGFKILMYRYSGQQDICVGTPIAGRQQEELEELIGFFVNTLALRTEVKGNASFTELLQQVKAVTMEAYENQEVPFEKVVDEVIKERDISRNPIFQVMFVMLNIPEVPVLKLGEVSLSLENAIHRTAKFDLQIFVTETPDGLILLTEYCTDLFRSETIIRMMTHYKQLLASIVEAPDLTVAEFSMLTIAEEQHLLSELNNTNVNYPKNNTVIELLEAQAIKTPDAIAVVFEEQHLSFSKLNQLANQLASHLKSLGIKEEMLVPICLDRSLQMIVSIWGVLKAGAAWVPIDPEYPEERIRYMLEDSRSSIIITNPESRNKIPVTDNLTVIELDEAFSLILDRPSTNLNLPVKANQLAYVIYTSGSTGKPKGAMNEHGGLANRLMWAQDYFKLNTTDAVLQKTTFCFDVSVWELLWPSLVGARLILARPGGQKDNLYIKSVIEKNNITLLHFVPSMLGVFLPDLQKDDCPSLKMVLCSGEALKSSQVELFMQMLPNVALHNLYGPTEAAIDVTCWSLTDEVQNISIIPIGKPVANTAMYILDDNNGLVPMGGIGELHIGGIQVGRGYLNQPELTAQKFVANPFDQTSGFKLYKTGDLGRWMIDGNIEYLGRKDEQVKVRGYRIELGEIETVLQENEHVSQAVVLAKTDKTGHTKLVSYYVPAWQTVKAKERALYMDRVANWKELYDAEYSSPIEGSFAEEFNLVGWNSSFSGEAIPPTEMKQWVDDIVAVILSRPAETVLEIGCGTGLIYYPLAGKVKKYIGTDLSGTSIRQILERIAKRERDYGDTELMTSAAHDVELPVNQNVDTIVLNSIIQYFPGEDYMNSVIEKCCSLLKGSGRIIIGDVRDKRLLELFKGRLQANMLQDAIGIQEFKWIVDQEVMKENEFCVDPAYFFNLKSSNPSISHVEVFWKKADYINELSLYRYTVVIHVGELAEVTAPVWQSWIDFTAIEAGFDQMMAAGATIAICNAPSPRLWREKALANALGNKVVHSVGDLLPDTDEQDADTIAINQLINKATACGYHHHLLLHEDAMKVNVIFEPVISNRIFQQPYHADRYIGQVTNIPLFTDISAQSQKDIRAMLQLKLPDYMVPADIIAVKQMPLTSNGKVDRKFLNHREERNTFIGNYIAPSTVLEQLLVNIWKELLGLEELGIDDNFFEMGGDSILTIQIVSRLRRMGYELQPKDIFLHQTIGKLSAAIAERSAGAIVGEQGILDGQAGLLPVQQWFLQSAQANFSHFNQSVLLGIDKTVTEAAITSVIETLLQHHDALRFVYTMHDEQWEQQYGSVNGTVTAVDIQSIPAEEITASITSIATTCQQSLDLTKGELIKVCWIQTPATEKNNRLLIVVHHLVIDGVSWRIFLEDFEILLNELNKAEKKGLGTKSSSIRQWYNGLELYGQSKRLKSQINYWQQASANYYPLPVKVESNQPVYVKEIAYLSNRLSAAETKRLLQDVPRVYHTEITDLLMAALAKTICDWTGNNSINIGLEGHGREDLGVEADTGRSIGWLTSLYPLLLQLPDSNTEADLIKSIKEQLRLMPDKGIGYGVLKYINKQPSLQGAEPWDILFNYLGQLDNVVRESNYLSGAPESNGPLNAAENQVNEKLSINSSVRNGELVFSWSYSSKHFDEATIQKLSQDYLNNLEKLINHCVQQQALEGSVFTPSDFGLVSEITYPELDRFLAESKNGKLRKNEIEGLYRLSGLQEGMLFHGLYDIGIGAYIEQFACDLDGINQEIFNKTWTHLMKRHSVLRSAFYVDAFKIPVQCVYKEVSLPLIIEDFRGLSPEEQELAIVAFDKTDWDKGFDFKEVPLMRLGLCRLTDSRYRMLWTSHHILFDGWSFPILMEEFLSTYDLLNAGSEALVTEEDRYEDYIRYIERSDKAKEEEYWRNYLKGVEHNTLLPFIGTTVGRNKGAGKYQALEINLEGAAAKRMHHFAQRHHLTLNTIMQGVWAYLLHHYTGNKDVVYGIIVSGRPDDLPGVEKRVGMYINTLPLHSTLKEDAVIVEWLQGIQAEQVHSRQYQHTPFPMVQTWSGVQGDLFDTLLTFENYPFSKAISTTKWALNVANVKMQDQTNYPLSIVISSSRHINIRFSYNAMLLSEGYATEIKDHFENVLMQILDKADGKVKDLDLLSQAEQQILLSVFNDTIAAVDKPGKTVIDLFEAQVLKTPDALALVFKEERLTYQQLNDRSNQLASLIESKGVEPETLIPVFVNRSMEMMVILLGILKSGCAFVPIDPEYPEERIAYILEDTAATLVICNTKSRSNLLAAAGLDLLEIDGDFINISQYSTVNRKVKIKGEQLAYIIYTSGSTGKPKGVMIEHVSFINYLLNEKTNYNGSAEKNSGSYIHLSYTFDAALTAMFMPLIAGRSIVIGSKQSIDIFEDKNLLQFAPYDFIKITPSHLELIHPKFQAFGKQLLTEKLVIGGEALHPAHFDSFVNSGINVTVINEYGPTEATVGCTVYSFETINDQEKISRGISIGKPIDNAAIYILDAKNNLVPIGVKGELCIGGAGLARGYLNLEVLTAEKFVANPFDHDNNQRIYKTGDIGRWLPDGNIEYLGRMDDQLKIRGYRIELGEIEQVLQQCDMVSQGVVVGKDEKQGGKKLVSYFVPDMEAVRVKERELNYQRVANWKELYEIEYGQTEEDDHIDPEFNIIGWNDSFTGGAMPAVDMKQWLDDIVKVVLSDEPGTVLEIGCGTGLIYYQLAGKVKKYIGCDLSKSSINQIKKQISKELRAYGDTELFTAPAHEVAVREGQEVNTVLLNSMVQYFPGEGYLDAVLDKSFSIINGKGRIIIGDVRDNRLLELFKGRLRIQKSQDGIQIKDYKWGLEQDIIKEEELCLSPGYFYNLKKTYPQITHIDIQWKQGDFINELSLYRFTVVIYVGIDMPKISPEWIKWENIAGLRQVLSNNDHHQNTIAVKNAPNPRLWKERALQRALHHTSLKSVGEMMQFIEAEDDESIQVRQLVKLAASKGYNCKILVNEDPLLADLLFEIEASNVFIDQPFVQDTRIANSNIPLFTDISFLLQKDIKDVLQLSLPDYMIPSEFRALRSLPITSNGKVDRIFLSQQEDKVFVNTLNYLPPVTTLETELAEIWKELLHLERVGIEDNFFDIGGHSLLAMRVIAAIRKKMEVELNIKDLFVNPTIALLAVHVQRTGKGLLLPAIQAIAPRPARIPLSFSQERLWFIDQLGGSLQYHMPEVLRLSGKPDIAALSDALLQIIVRHEVLRTIIWEDQGQGFQQIREASDWNLSVIDGARFMEDEAGLRIFIKEIIDIPFNLTSDFMLRASLIQLSETESILVAVLHHIASDGWSSSILVKELATFYNAYPQQLPSMPPLAIQFADFAIWQRKYLKGEAWEKKLSFWKNNLDGVTALQLPTDYPRPVLQSTNGAISRFKLDVILSDQLKDLSQQEGVTLFMTLLAAFNILLHRYSGQQDICVGTPIAGRQQQELEGLIGFFVNTLALRTQLDSGASFKDLLKQVSANTLEAYDHQEVPFEKVVELTVRERDMSRSPLFQVMLALQNTPELQDLRLGELQVSSAGTGLSGYTTSKFELVFNITETPSGLYLLVEYCTDLFSAETINRLADHFKNLLQSIVAEPAMCIGDLPMLSGDEIKPLLIDVNNMQTNFTPDKTVLDMFAEQVASHPSGIALISGEEEITYVELDERSNKLAHFLVNKGVESETIVPVCMMRTTSLITAMLGILKAGGAYLPIDPEYPGERIAFMVQDSGAAFVLTNTDTSHLVPVPEGVNVIDVEKLEQVINDLPLVAINNKPVLTQLVYVIYTSGSTGRPKGVMIEHRNLSNLIGWHNSEYQVTNTSKATAMAGVGFDAFGWEVWPYLSCGATVCIIDDDTRLNATRLFSLLALKKITHCFIATAILQDFVTESFEKNLSLQYVLTGGDKLPFVENKGWDYKLVNNYGPTENTVVTSHYELFRKAETFNLPIGKPVANTVVYILSDRQHLVPVGVTGELYIGGSSLARGYLNRPDLTADKFIDNPFLGTYAATKTIYKSGDLCRWLPDGNLEYIGRVDEQVKIRGYRIELGEIEHVLAEHSDVEQAVVLATPDAMKNLRLVAYVKSRGSFNRNELVGWLKDRLPEYMVPTVWIEIDQFPLTSNGKLNKKALPDIASGLSLTDEYVAPVTETEIELVSIWKELLHVERIGVNDNFFELGGHSLLAMRMVAYIERQLSISIPIKVLFQFTCISDLSKYIETQQSTSKDEVNTSFDFYDV